MSTALTACDKVVYRLAILRTTAITFTGMRGVAAAPVVQPYQPRQSSSLSDEGRPDFPLFAHLVIRGPRSPEEVVISPLFTQGPGCWLVVEPGQREGGEVEAAIEVFARRVARLPAVRAVSHASDRAAHLIWTFISQRDKALRRQVYQEELRLMAGFPHFTFDFNVVALDRAERPSFLPDDLQGQLIYYREGSV